jgi:hypothetical protein
MQVWGKGEKDRGRGDYNQQITLFTLIDKLFG